MLKLDWIIAAVIAGTVLAPAWAGTPINETRPLQADGRVSVNNLAGEIVVSAWDKKEVSISGELGADVEKLDISGDAGSLKIYVRYPRNNRNRVEETLLKLNVPRAAAVTLEAVSADLRINGIEGELHASSVSGEVQAEVESRDISLETVSGDINLRAPSQRAELHTVSGDINVEGGRGSVKSESVSGDVKISGGPFESVSAEAVSGDIIVDCALGGRSELSAESLSGDINVRLAQTPNASISLKTFSGELGGEFGPQSGDTRKFDAVLGDGKGQIDLHSFSGDIRLGKR
ncbi:DUF4097 domain-containing protein [Sinimarinibacterium sp. CAU 1509]|uniref:DUF4097 family beta strand repeat-containing protein n=1 Tax=Sinimarinibacterium sp. CAU 1509 TaxID=2562283 RepID=UPI0010AB82BD|nr:DUF4097 family beta strand repeat-containing protein [Sinimarinibacterium sp. CAU 1509]TJY65229.1 DUF4097 domain-containing protein [Sinimarinibacterium sp. CAU 1509]